ncbi:UNVERIFIED_CONTAM: hypothetical protein Sindi_0968000 [Sesamum indicum]
MGKGKRKTVKESWIQNIFVLIAVKMDYRRGSILKSSIVKVVKRSRRLRQTVLKLSNGRVVAIVVKGLHRLSH